MKEYYQDLNTKCLATIERTFSTTSNSNFSKNHNFIHDIEAWMDLLDGRPEIPLLTSALREYQMSLFSAAQGNYRNAFTSLRLFFELSLNTAYLSTNEINLRLWKSNKYDLKWSSIIDSENGLFSKKFANAFNEELIDHVSQYQTLASELYRECSEFVHGNEYTFRILPEEMKFDDNLFDSWCSKANDICMTISFVFCLRYIKDLQSVGLDKIENSIMDYLSHVTSIRELLGK